MRWPIGPSRTAWACLRSRNRKGTSVSSVSGTKLPTGPVEVTTISTVPICGALDHLALAAERVRGNCLIVHFPLVRRGEVLRHGGGADAVMRGRRQRIAELELGRPGLGRGAESERAADHQSLHHVPNPPRARFGRASDRVRRWNAKGRASAAPAAQLAPDGARLARRVGTLAEAARDRRRPCDHRPMMIDCQGPGGAARARGRRFKPCREQGRPGRCA